MRKNISVKFARYDVVVLVIAFVWCAQLQLLGAVEGLNECLRCEYVPLLCHTEPSNCRYSKPVRPPCKLICPNYTKHYCQEGPAGEMLWNPPLDTQECSVVVREESTSSQESTVSSPATSRTSSTASSGLSSIPLFIIYSTTLCLNIIITLRITIPAGL